jgi:hypothetical protein
LGLNDLRELVHNTILGEERDFLVNNTSRADPRGFNEKLRPRSTSVIPGYAYNHIVSGKPVDAGIRRSIPSFTG